MTALSTLSPMLRIKLPGIPQPVLDAAIVRVARQFFWRSEVWKYTSDNGKDWTFNVTAAPTLIAGSDIPAGTVVKRIDTVKYDADGSAWDDEIPFKTRDELDRENADWETESGSSPSAWTNESDGSARIVPKASATISKGLLLRAIIAPSDSVDTVIPDFLFYENEEVIKSGVLAQLMEIPGKDWTDPQSAALNLSLFAAGIKNAKSRAEAAYGQPKDTMTYGGL
jgi:hypothetical protein